MVTRVKNHCSSVRAHTHSSILNEKTHKLGSSPNSSICCLKDFG